MEALILFAVAAVASFIGSLQAGLVNTAVLAHTIKRGAEAGRRMAVGGAIPELIYAGVAFRFASLVIQWMGLSKSGIGMLVGTILIAIGAYFIFVFKPVFAVDEIQVKASGVRRGLVLGLLNPQLLLFWCGVKLMITAFGVGGEGWMDLLAFAMGAFAGALILLLQLVRLGRKAVEKLSPSSLRLMFRLVGLALVISGLIGIIRTRPAGEEAASGASQSGLRNAAPTLEASPGDAHHVAQWC